MAKKTRKIPKGKRVDLSVEDEPTGVGFKARFLPGGVYDHASPAHQYGRFLVAQLHKALKDHGFTLEYEQHLPSNLDTAQQLPSNEASPIILPPGVQVEDDRAGVPAVH